MNRKKISTLIATLALVGTIGLGATLAYLTDSEQVTNRMTVGTVDINLTEETTQPGTVTGETGINFETPILPGDIVSKKPIVKLASDSQDSYVRVSVVVSDVANKKALPDTAKNDVFEDVKGKITATGDWVYSNGYFYYQNIAKATDTDGYVLFETVEFNPEWKNEVKNSEFTIDIKAEAVQARNFDLVLERANGQIIGWGNTVIE